MGKANRTTVRPLPPIGNAHRLLSFVYLDSFLADWKAEGLTEDDAAELERIIRDRPEVGPVMAGTGGLRKFRFAPAKGGKGKRGSERVCYALFPVPGIVLLAVVFGKGEKDNLDAAERNAIKADLENYAAELKGRARG